MKTPLAALAVALTCICPAVGDPAPARPDLEAIIPHARSVVAAVVEAGRRNARLPARGTPGAAPLRRRDDELTAYYVRAAAAAARRVPAEHAVSAFLLGIGVALDDSDLLRNNPVTAPLWRQIESPAARADRLEVLGKPTVHGRHDLCQHFAVSGALTAVAGPRAAEAAGVLKEVLDARPGGSGFSFADLAADLAGVAFADELARSPRRLAEVARSFAVEDFTVPPAGLPEGLSQSAFARQYGSTADERFLAKVGEIRKSIRSLPAYQDP
jgi:hypothetical protein